jgi:aspartyl-tRNA(Asn)/glutamyl-tRNA(Gln) amidotransferase subunit C
MEFPDSEVRRIAKLARLRLGDEECSRLRGEFPRILELVAGLPADDGIQAADPETPASVRRLREDEPGPFPDPESLLALAPEREGNYYKVRKVIE